VALYVLDGRNNDLSFVRKVHLQIVWLW
jgi:hypothetical protein